MLEDLIAKLENGTNGYAFASGLAAIDAVVKLLSTGDEIIAVDDIYGGAFRLFTHVYQKFGITVKYVDATNAENVAANITFRRSSRIFGCYRRSICSTLSLLSNKRSDGKNKK